MIKNLGRKVVYGLVFAIFIYVLLLVWGARSGLSSALNFFNWLWLPFLCLLSLLNLLVRFLKWHYYLHVLQIRIPIRDSMLIFFSGLPLSITPGKIGEVIKSFYLKKGFGQPISTTAPIVLADRLTDFLSLVIIAFVGAISFSYGQKVVFAVALAIILIILSITNKTIAEAILRGLKKIKFIQRQTDSLQRLYDSSYALLKFRVIVFPILLSIIAWSFEALEFYFVFILLRLGDGFLAPFFIYSFSVIVGAVSMLPGGLGVAEGSFVGLLRFLSIDTGFAVLATLIIRLATLWFAIIFSLPFLLVAEKKYGNIDEDFNSYQRTPKGKVRYLHHVHTTFSKDGLLTPHEVVNYCREKNIAAVSICDHNEIDGAINAEKIAAGNPLVIIGEEIKTSEGEIIGLFLKEKIESSLSLLQTIQEIRRQGGLVLLPHPGDPVRHSAINKHRAEAIIGEVDIVEAFNSRNIFPTGNRLGLNLVKCYAKAAVAGADAHTRSELSAAINILPNFANKNEYLRSLKNNKYFGSRTGILIQLFTAVKGRFVDISRN